MLNVNVILSKLSTLINISIEILFILINISIVVLLHGLNFYIFACETRLVLYWFLNINPYLSPWNKLTNLTKPINDFGSTFYPRIFSIKLNYYINLFILRKLLVFLESVNYYKSVFLNYKPKIQLKLPELNSIRKRFKVKRSFSYRIKKMIAKKFLRLLLILL